MIENKKILVTGAGGFIGGHLIKELLKHNNKNDLIKEFFTRECIRDITFENKLNSLPNLILNLTGL